MRAALFSSNVRREPTNMTRPETVRRMADRATNRLLSDLIPLLRTRDIETARRLINRRHARLADDTNAVYRTFPNRPGEILLVETDDADEFGIYATIDSAQRISRARRDIPTESLLVYRTFQVDRVRSARSFILESLKERTGVWHTHDAFFRVPGGVEAIEGFIARKVLQVNRKTKPVAAPSKRAFIFGPRRHVVTGEPNPRRETIVEQV